MPHPPPLIKMFWEILSLVLHVNYIKWKFLFLVVLRKPYKFAVLFDQVYLMGTTLNESYNDALVYYLEVA